MLHGKFVSPSPKNTSLKIAKFGKHCSKCSLSPLFSPSLYENLRIPYCEGF